MDGPGISLFQSSDLLKLNRANAEEDEAEALEEENRRQAMLEEVMVNGFDDLPLPSHPDEHDESFASSGHHLNNHSNHTIELSDNETTAKSIYTKKSLAKDTVTNDGDTALSAHYNHCFHNRGGDDTTSDQSNSPVKIRGGGDADQLAELYGVRMREIIRLQEAGVQREAEWSKRCEILEKKNFRLEAEKATAQTACTQAQALLVNSKEQIGELIKELELVRQRNHTMETKNEDLEKELLISRTTVETLQTKINVLERGNMQRVGEAQTDALLKSLQERHRKEVNSIQQQLDAYVTKVEAMETALKEAEQRAWEGTRRHENMLLERSETVNRLTRALEESQQHCQELLSSHQHQPSFLTTLSEKKQLEDKVAHLQAQLEWAKADVDHLETLVGLGVLNTSDAEWLDKGKKKSDILRTMEGLRDELTRSLRNQEARRIEIKRLNQELEEREQEIMEMKQQEGKYQQVVAKLKEESDKLVSQVQQQRLSQCDNETISKISKENVQLRQCISELEYQRDQLKKQLNVLQEQNSALAEQTVELQRSAEEDKLRTIDAHSTEYLAFHQRAVAVARQQEREQAEANLNQIRLELELERKNGDEIKEAYVNLVQSKTATMEEIEALKQKLQNSSEKQSQESPTRDAAADIEQLRIQYEQKVINEVEQAKHAILKEVEVERKNIVDETKSQMAKEFDVRLAQAKAEWESQQSSTQLMGDDKLQEEILRLKQVLKDQKETFKKQQQALEEQAWSHFKEELQRITEAPGSPRSYKSESRATSPIHFPVNDATTSPLKKGRDLEAQVQILLSHLEETKTKHASKLADLQAHLQIKHQEMEEFKKKVIEFTRKQVEAQEKDTMEYINALKKEISSLTTELKENKKISDDERTKLNSMIQSWTAEIKEHKAEKKNAETNIVTLKNKLASLQEKYAQLKDYYERREKCVREEYRKREEKFFETLIKLKRGIDSLSSLEFPKFANRLECPTKDN